VPHQLPQLVLALRFLLQLVMQWCLLALAHYASTTGLRCQWSLGLPLPIRGSTQRDRATQKKLMFSKFQSFRFQNSYFQNQKSFGVQILKFLNVVPFLPYRVFRVPLLG
jgi:hypothetical protein